MAESLTQAMARWAADGWRGRAPLRPIFWGGGAVWFFGYFIERGVVNLFLLPHSPYPLAVSPVMAVMLRLSEWILLGIFIWWCISVWKCADAEGRGLWPVTAKGIVALLVIANAVSAIR